ncbi:MAG: type IV pilus assembly protein PilQ [Candidatus Krumholzibacteriia bacterium]|jgi:type IV pilus assembly protein PilQ
MNGKTRFTVNGLIIILVMVTSVAAVAQDNAIAEDSATEAAAPVAESKYMGRPISLDVQDAEIGTVLRSLSSFSGVNIVASPRVVGKVTVKLEEVPWEEALAVILRAHSFDFIEEQGIYRVDTAEELRDEELSEQRARKQVEDLEVLNLGMAKLEYANAEEVKNALEKMLTDRGNIDVDVRTNSLLVNDIAARVALITDMAFQLDTQTPQVEINARLVDIDTRATRELGINWGAGNVSIPGSNINGSLDISNPVQNPAGDLRIGTVQDWGTLMLQVEALENDQKAHLISNPVITTTDNREASILVGQKIPLIVADEAGNAITQLTTIGILLKVTPHINTDNRITLDVHNEVSDLSSQATVQGGVIINTSESDTRVLVDSGDTAIIAGLIRKVDSKLDSGIPILMDIPLIGSLFRHSSDTVVSRELVIFVTPTIVEDGYLERDTMFENGEVTYEPEKLSRF